MTLILAYLAVGAIVWGLNLRNYKREHYDLFGRPVTLSVHLITLIATLSIWPYIIYRALRRGEGEGR